ncbi:hypothetical protein [Thalassobacillus cyri]|nr:hypothetical protein [Thalassobacillus cyri]
MDEVRFGSKATTFDNTVTTYQMPEEERRKRMKVNPMTYIEYKEKGWTDARIAEEMGIHAPVLSQKKSKWGFTGKSLDEMKKIAKKHTTKKQRDTAYAAKFDDQIKEDVREKQAVKEESEKDNEPQEKEAAVTTEKKYGELQTKYEESQKTIQKLEDQAADALKKYKNSQEEMIRLQGIERDYEKLQGTNERMKEEIIRLQNDLSQATSKQSYALVEQQLETAHNSHERTKQELDDAMRRIEQKNKVIDAYMKTEHNLSKKLALEIERHKKLSGYTKLLMEE